VLRERFALAAGDHEIARSTPAAGTGGRSASRSRSPPASRLVLFTDFVVNQIAGQDGGASAAATAG
jgi:hypothetical protein